jgi:leucyl aminopeptidase
MNITVQQGEIQKRTDAAVVVNLFEGTKPGGATAAMDKALHGLVSTVLKSGDFSGKKNQTTVLYTQDRGLPKRVLLVGLGKRKALSLEGIRQAAGTAAGKLQGLGVERASTILHGAGAGGLAVEDAAQALAEGSLLACYRFDEYTTSPSSDEPPRKRLKSLTVVEFDPTRMSAIRKGVKAGKSIAEATCLARDLANQPGNTATPTYLAGIARRLARQYGLSCRILDENAMKKLGMGALLGVSRGSQQPARFIILEHGAGKRGKASDAGGPLVFVGKGVTFDSGGISLKPGLGMEDMKFDMSGAAAVFGTMQAVAALKVPRHIVGLIAATENLPSSTALKPGDVLRTLTGQTIEIINTDAEGRLILADALGYAARYKPAAVIDLATLTGACVVALGHHASGLMTNNQKLANRVSKAGDETGERTWQLPLWDDYRAGIRSSVADMKNAGGRAAGAITGAMLLAEFTKSYPWVHLDIAGTAWSAKSNPYIPKGGVGVGVRLLTQLARTWEVRGK